ncbi:MAG: acetyl-CoA carboxylase, carboxyltransferase subunit beta [Bacteroidota bacterium]|nr:acetyl-CoA carboxylase, carboxyltransferase subunit beta [Candidatus Kapabacteria bacterium]MDW8221088.1 acetyl-CoA carboxylase, carboxyltransferase subunit beta [Bacteroidota bacterium]
MAWFFRPKTSLAERSQVATHMPDGLWTKCDTCGEIIYKKQLEEALYTCPKCHHHFRISTKEYIAIIFDEDSFVETHHTVRSADPLEFVDTKPYIQRLQEAYAKNDAPDALTTGYGTIAGRKISFASMNFNFIGGSMGSVVGEKFARAANLSLQERIPLLAISASGGARMQEAALSLMQMAKTSAKLAQLSEAGIPYLSLMTDPTTGGVSASFAMLGDINIAEPGALIGFAGPRVIEQTIRKKLPEGFQSSEFLLEHGFLDMIVHRKQLRQTLIQLLGLLCD